MWRHFWQNDATANKDVQQFSVVSAGSVSLVTAIAVIDVVGGHCRVTATFKRREWP
jgi:hypothetical protein